MRLLIILLGIFFCEWVAYLELDSDSFWYFTLCSKQITIALCLSLTFSFVQAIDLRTRSVLAFLCCNAWLDVPLKIMWAMYGLKSTGIAPLAAFLLVWSLWVMSRAYEIKSDEVNHDNVMLLLLRPSSFTMMVKSFFGAPVSSVCILADGYVWSFRKNSEKFCKTKYTDKWLVRHICVDTGVSAAAGIVSSLRCAEGAKKGVGIRCVYTIRHILKKLGRSWGPRTFLQYIPGLYAMQILRGRHDRA